jgi:hypothetical protein
MTENQSKTDKFERFVPQSAHISDAILGNDELTPHKILNFQVRLNLEMVQSFTQPAPTKVQIAQELADAIVKQFERLNFWPQDGAKKFKITTDTPAKEGEFGYYLLS